jgi:hypothetical protein
VSEKNPGKRRGDGVRDPMFRWAVRAFAVVQEMWHFESCIRS